MRMVRAMIPVRQETRYWHGGLLQFRIQNLLTTFFNISLTAPLKVSYLCIIIQIKDVCHFRIGEVKSAYDNGKERGDNSGNNSIGEDSYKDTDSDKNSHRQESDMRRVTRDL